MRSFLSAEKRRIIFKSFIESQCKYCPLTCSRKSSNKINKLHERSLRIVNNDYESTYEELLSHNICFSIHDQNIHLLANEMYKVANVCQWEISKICLILKTDIPYISL